MTQIKSFCMKGHEILNPKDFCTYFSPKELLRQSEMAAGFARRQLSRLSPWHNYHGEMLFKAVFCYDDLYDRGITERGNGYEIHVYAGDFYEKIVKKDSESGELTELELRPCGLINAAELYLQIQGVWRNVKSEWLDAEVQRLSEVMREDCPRLLENVSRISQAAALEERQKERLFFILAAGYFLAGDIDMTHGISAAEAESAYLRKEVREEHTPKETKNGLVFAASDDEYILERSDKTTTSSIHRITTKKLIAVQSAQGAVKKPAKLNLGGEITEIMPGDYRYASCILDKPIRIFPTMKENGSVRMERKGDFIELSINGTVNTIDCTGRSILDFAADKSGKYILLEPELADYSHFPTSLSLPDKNIIEVDIRDNDVYLLNQIGEVTKNGQPIQQSKFPTSLKCLKY